MKPELFALLTAAAWGIGGYFEKKGLHQGNLSPEIGITLRTAIALTVLGLISFPQWKSVCQAGAKPLLYMIVGGGLVAGSLGMLCFYTALKGAALGRVMPIAFTAPLFGVLAAMIFGGEILTIKTMAGMLLTVSGIAVLTMQ